MQLLSVLRLFLCSPQLPAGEQRGPARRRLPHLPVSGEGADQTLKRSQLFSSGGQKPQEVSIHTLMLSHTLLLALLAKCERVKSSEEEVRGKKTF